MQTEGASVCIVTILIDHKLQRQDLGKETFPLGLCVISYIVLMCMYEESEEQNVIVSKGVSLQKQHMTI